MILIANNIHVKDGVTTDPSGRFVIVREIFEMRDAFKLAGYEFKAIVYLGTKPSDAIRAYLESRIRNQREPI